MDEIDNKIINLEIRSGYSKKMIFISRVAINKIISTIFIFFYMLYLCILLLIMDKKEINFWLGDIMINLLYIFLFDLILSSVSILFATSRKKLTVVVGALLLSATFLLLPIIGYMALVDEDSDRNLGKNSSMHIAYKANLLANKNSGFSSLVQKYHKFEIDNNNIIFNGINGQRISADNIAFFGVEAGTQEYNKKNMKYYENTKLGVNEFIFDVLSAGMIIGIEEMPIGFITKEEKEITGKINLNETGIKNNLIYKLLDSIHQSEAPADKSEWERGYFTINSAYGQEDVGDTFFAKQYRFSNLIDTNEVFGDNDFDEIVKLIQENSELYLPNIANVKNNTNLNKINYSKAIYFNAYTFYGEHLNKGEWMQHINLSLRERLFCVGLNAVIKNLLKIESSEYRIKGEIVSAKVYLQYLSSRSWNPLRFFSNLMFNNSSNIDFGYINTPAPNYINDIYEIIDYKGKVDIEELLIEKESNFNFNFESDRDGIDSILMAVLKVILSSPINRMNIFDTLTKKGMDSMLIQKIFHEESKNNFILSSNSGMEHEGNYWMYIDIVPKNIARDFINTKIFSFGLKNPIMTFDDGMSEYDKTMTLFLIRKALELTDNTETEESKTETVFFEYSKRNYSKINYIGKTNFVYSKNILLIFVLLCSNLGSYYIFKNKIIK
ncbi:hypothetical protein [[Acholeplasma] multilocale]|uniref:hypothetical protein n=1 Tax=[Acholeplasma] multilocale TaxID=264638 RepID=UPI0012ECB9EB|nr:hypothetical protein [[Acholeplasma] multilocale]